MTQQQQKFQAILANKAFDELTPYRDPKIWETLQASEKDLLALLFIRQGEEQLLQGQEQVLDTFAIAHKIAPNSVVVHYEQALALSKREDSVHCLQSAVKSLEKALHLDPNFVAGWHCLGVILVKIGVFHHEIDYFYQADKKFHEAEHLVNIQGIGTLTDTFYWHWGVAWYNIGRHSGEAIDYFRALEKFRLSEKAGCNMADFYCEFGRLLMELAALVTNRQELFNNAVEHFKKSLQVDKDKYEARLNLAISLLRLYDMTGTYQYFLDANVSFEIASQLMREDPSVWLHWGDLLVNVAKITRDIDRIQESFEKFEVALSLEYEDPHIFLKWGEAEILLGSYTEDLQLLEQAKQKIQRGLSLNSRDPDAWYIFGVCIYELGRYFSSPEHYLNALEKFETGLLCSHDHPLILHGIAQVYYILGEMGGDLELILKSLQYFEKAAVSDRLTIPQFFNDWGVAYMKIGEMTNDKAAIEAAAEKFEKAINKRLDVHAEDVELEWLYNYGCAMDFLGDFQEESIYYEKAVQVLSHVLQVDPEYHHARYNLALAYYHIGDLNGDVETLYQAMDLFQEIIARDAEDELAWNDLGMTLLSLAILLNDPIHTLESHRLFEQAENKFKQALALGNINAHYNLAALYALTGHALAAIHYLEKAEQAKALPAADVLMHDEWLESLHNHPEFRKLIYRLLNPEEEV